MGERTWSADDVLALVRGYQGACVLAAGADLDVFTHLSRTPRTAAETARELACDERALTILLDALAALGLLAKSGGLYATAPGADALLSSETRGSVLPMIRHHANCLRRWVQLPVVVAQGRPAQRSVSMAGEAADLAAFIGGMHAIAEPVAARLIAEIQAVEFAHLLDVGGASGSWTIAFLQACPRARATLFDLPAVIPLAETRLIQAGLRDRVTLVGGDFLRSPLPHDADLAWLSAIVHQNSRKENRRLFASIFEALLPGGRLLVRDVVMDPSRTAPVAGALFAVNMLVGTEAGGTFTFAELREDLEAAGFSDVALLRRDEGMHSVVAAVKSAAP